jgi:hypothetical protein
MENADLANIYRRRRSRLMQQMDQGVAIVSQAFGAADPYLNDKNLEYLTGVKDRDTILVLAPDGVTINQWASLKT